MITIDLKYTLICLVLFALFVLLIALVILVKNLISAVRNLNKVIDDASVVSQVASERVSQVDGIVGDLGEALNQVVEAMKGNRSLIGAVTNVAKAVSSTLSYFRDTGGDKRFMRKGNKKNSKRC